MLWLMTSLPKIYIDVNSVLFHSEQTKTLVRNLRGIYKSWRWKKMVFYEMNVRSRFPSFSQVSSGIVENSMTDCVVSEHERIKWWLHDENISPVFFFLSLHFAFVCRLICVYFFVLRFVAHALAVAPTYKKKLMWMWIYLSACNVYAKRTGKAKCETSTLAREYFELCDGVEADVRESPSFKGAQCKRHAHSECFRNGLCQMRRVYMSMGDVWWTQTTPTEWFEIYYFLHFVWCICMVLSSYHPHSFNGDALILFGHFSMNANPSNLWFFSFSFRFTWNRWCVTMNSFASKLTYLSGSLTSITGFVVPRLLYEKWWIFGFLSCELIMTNAFPLLLFGATVS